MSNVARLMPALVTNLSSSKLEGGVRKSYSSTQRHRGSYLSLVPNQPKLEGDLIRDFLASIESVYKAPGDRRKVVRRLVREAGFEELLAEERRPLADVDRSRLKAMLVDGPDFSVKPPARWHDRTDRNESPPDFIRREYAPWLGQGLMQAHIRRHDRELYQALAGWQQRMGKLPPEFGLPTRKDMTDRLLAENVPFDEATLVAASRWQDRMRTRKRRADSPDKAF